MLIYVLSTDAFVDISYELIRPFLLICAPIPPFGFVPSYFATYLKTDIIKYMGLEPAKISVYLCIHIYT